MPSTTVRVAITLVLHLVPLCVSAQELTPGAYWPLPVRLNILTFVNSRNWGAVAFDPALPAEDSRGTIETVAIAYTRTLSIAGRSANVGLQVPVLGGLVEGLSTVTRTSTFKATHGSVGDSRGRSISTMRFERR